MLRFCQFPVISTAHQWKVEPAHILAGVANFNILSSIFQSSLPHPPEKNWDFCQVNVWHSAGIWSLFEDVSPANRKRAYEMSAVEVCSLSPREKPRFVELRIVLTRTRWHFMRRGISTPWHLEKKKHTEKHLSETTKMSNEATLDGTSEPSIALHSFNLFGKSLGWFMWQFPHFRKHFRVCQAANLLLFLAWESKDKKYN